MGLLFTFRFNRFVTAFEKWISEQLSVDEREEKYLEGLLICVVHVRERHYRGSGEYLKGSKWCGYSDAAQIFADIANSEKIPTDQFVMLVSMASFRRTAFLSNDVEPSLRYQYDGHIKILKQEAWQKLLDDATVPADFRQYVRDRISEVDRPLNDPDGQPLGSYGGQLLQWVESSLRSGHHSPFGTEYLKGVHAAARIIYEAGADGVAREVYTTSPSTPFECGRRHAMISYEDACDAGQTEVNISEIYEDMEELEEVKEAFFNGGEGGE